MNGANAHRVLLTGGIMNRTSARGVNFDGASLTGSVIELADLRPYPRIDGTEFCDMTSVRAEVNAFAAGAGLDVLEPGEPIMKAFTVGGACRGQQRPARCACMTSMVEANLNGANLIAAQLENVNLRGASLLGVTFGESPEGAAVRPDACIPDFNETFGRVGCLHQQRCGGNQGEGVDACGVGFEERFDQRDQARLAPVQHCALAYQSHADEPWCEDAAAPWAVCIIPGTYDDFIATHGAPKGSPGTLPWSKRGPQTFQFRDQWASFF